MFKAILERFGAPQAGLLAALDRSQSIIEFAPDGTILDANANFLSTFGYTLPELEGKHHSLFLEKGARESADYRDFWTSLLKGAFRTGEFRRFAKGGREIWLQASYHPVSDGRGGIAKIVKIASDITESKLRSNENRGWIEAIGRSQAVIAFDLDGTILEANQNFLSAIGYSLEEIRGRHHSLFVDKAERESTAYRDFWAALKRGEFRSGEFRRIGKGGREVWIQASYNPILDPNGKPIKVVKFASDITKSKLQTAEYVGQIAAIGRSQAVIAFDLDGTILDANENFLAAIGYSLEEIRGRHHSLFVDKAERESTAYRDFWAALKRGEFRSGEFRRIGKGGREVWIQASYNPILDPNGKPIKVVKFASDVTAAVHARIEAEKVAAEVDRKLVAIVEAAKGASSQATSASSASSQTAANVQAVAAASEEYDAAAREIAASMERSRSSIDRVSEEIDAANGTTTSLSEAAQSMNEIVKLIQDIAAQINLLALNATIESARAGEAGKGFAVVANEVKSLAGQVANATSQIAGEISRMQSVAGEVVGKLSAIRTSIEPVQESVASVAGAVEQQTATSREVSDNMQTAAMAVAEMNDKLAGIAQAVSEASRLAEEGVTLYRKLKAVA